MKGQIELGDIARDTITGLTGVVIGESRWLYGCRRFGLQPKELKDGKPVEAVFFDEPQLELVQKGHDPKKTTGGPAPVLRRHPDPKR